MQEESKEKSKDAPFESLRILSERWKNGTFSEIIDDWKWIFGYSARYKGAIVFYTILGIYQPADRSISQTGSNRILLCPGNHTLRSIHMSNRSSRCCFAS